MIEGLALADAEAAHGAGSTTVAPLVAAAVDKTLTQAFAGESVPPSRIRPTGAELESEVKIFRCVRLVVEETKFWANAPSVVVLLY